MKDNAFARSSQALTSGGKPVVRAEFAYTSARVRPGLENDLREQYESRIKAYEDWLRKQGYRGYSRTIGESVPAMVNANLNYLPEGQ